MRIEVEIGLNQEIVENNNHNDRSSEVVNREDSDRETRILPEEWEEELDALAR